MKACPATVYPLPCHGLSPALSGSIPCLSDHKERRCFREERRCFRTRKPAFPCGVLALVVADRAVSVLQLDDFGKLMTSSEDGTVRVWRFGKSGHGCAPVLDDTGTGTTDGFTSSVIDLKPQVKKQTDGRKTRKPPTTNITTTVWSLDDSRIVAAATHNPGGLSLSVWDAAGPLKTNGKVRKIFELVGRQGGHVGNDPNVEVYVLAVHPTDKRVVLSACTDGKARETLPFLALLLSFCQRLMPFLALLLSFCQRLMPFLVVLQAMLWDIYTGVLLKSIEVGLPSPLSMSISPVHVHAH